MQKIKYSHFFTIYLCISAKPQLVLGLKHTVWPSTSLAIKCVLRIPKLAREVGRPVRLGQIPKFDRFLWLPLINMLQGDKQT